jgi:hypothetical protein
MQHKRGGKAKAHNGPLILRISVWAFTMAHHHSRATARL